METQPPPIPTEGALTFGLDGLDVLLNLLLSEYDEVYGPHVRNGVITHDILRSVDDLPHGWTDEQEGGRYRLVARDDGARFGYAVGPDSWKELLHPPRTKVWSMTRARSGELEVEMHEPEAPSRAFFGVRPCEMAAIAKQDRVLLEGPHPDPAYEANRRNVFLVAVNCGDPAETCFCTSMGTGPAAGAGPDIVLTELVDGPHVSYVAEARTDPGVTALSYVESHAPGVMATSADEIGRATRVTLDAAGRITRRLDTTGIKELLYDKLESARWGEVAERCLACANCTLACPTCFCTDLEDVTDLTGDHAERWRTWDSCFSAEYSQLGPRPQRSSVSSRYRQWLTHKLGTWIDQFDESGCVGCGRCITWCPVGIDLTEEVALLRAESDR